MGPPTSSKSPAPPCGPRPAPRLLQQSRHSRCCANRAAASVRRPCRDGAVPPAAAARGLFTPRISTRIARCGPTPLLPHRPAAIEELWGAGGVSLIDAKKAHHCALGYVRSRLPARSHHESYPFRLRRRITKRCWRKRKNAAAQPSTPTPRCRASGPVDTSIRVSRPATPTGIACATTRCPPSCRC